MFRVAPHHSGHDVALQTIVVAWRDISLLSHARLRPPSFPATATQATPKGVWHFTFVRPECTWFVAPPVATPRRQRQKGRILRESLTASRPIARVKAQLKVNLLVKVKRKVEVKIKVNASIGWVMRRCR